MTAMGWAVAVVLAPISVVWVAAIVAGRRTRRELVGEAVRDGVRLTRNC